MTAHEFIAQLFSRPSYSLRDNSRRITRAQLDLLRTLIGEDKDAGAVQRGIGDGFTWLPAGRDKYVVTEDPRGNGATIERLASIVPSDMDSLF